MIGLLFIVLLLMYFSAAFILYLSFKLLFFGMVIAAGPFFTKMDFFRVLTVSTVLAAVHFSFSAFGAASSLMARIGAAPPDPSDGIHRRFMNIMDEIHVATGHRREIKGLIVPSLSMNALAAADLKGYAAIAITEGLLSRLTRPQLESVIAHEAYHILSGDCVGATVAVGIFGMFTSALDRVRNFGDERYPGLHPVFWLFWIMLKLSELLSLFISREREYRADAGAVRMTRNPLAMAEALHFLSRNWTGSGIIGPGIEMLCIVNPLTSATGASEMEDSEGWWASLVSTHPPLGRRIAVLLKMAHAGPSALEKRDGEKKVSPLSAAPVGPQSGYKCPACRQYLLEISYEQTEVHQCGICLGVLVENKKIPRIVARREIECTERTRALAAAVTADNQMLITSRRMKADMAHPRTSLKCPKCGNPMFRTFYSMAYLIEIDRCGICGLTWFDRDELEMLQCIIENRITARLELPAE